jgi:hypothetical protein
LLLQKNQPREKRHFRSSSGLGRKRIDLARSDRGESELGRKYERQSVDENEDDGE